MVPTASREAGVRCWHFQASGTEGVGWGERDGSRCLPASAGGRERLTGAVRVPTTLATLTELFHMPGPVPSVLFGSTLISDGQLPALRGVGGGEAGSGPGADEDLLLGLPEPQGGQWSWSPFPSICRALSALSSASTGALRSQTS